MKKLFLLLTLSILSLPSFSQNISYARAYQLNTGTKVGDDIVWVEKPIVVDVLISIDDKVVTMYSDITQVYHTISLVEENTTVNKWLCSDVNGTRCHLYIGKLNLSDKTIFFGVEYSDYSWVYFCNPEN